MLCSLPCRAAKILFIIVSSSGRVVNRQRRLYLKSKRSALYQPTCTKRKQPPFRVTVSFGGDKRDRTADLLNAIERLTTISGIKVNEIVNNNSFRTLILMFRTLCFFFVPVKFTVIGPDSRGVFKRPTGIPFREKSFGQRSKNNLFF